MKTPRAFVGAALLLAALLATAPDAFSQNAPEARLARFPYVQLATTTSIMIIWKTDSATQGAVEYGLTTAMGSRKEGEVFDEYYIEKAVAAGSGATD